MISIANNNCIHFDRILSCIPSLLYIKKVWFCFENPPREKSCLLLFMLVCFRQ